jgi:hypothetical protein
MTSTSLDIHKIQDVHMTRTSLDIHKIQDVHMTRTSLNIHKIQGVHMARTTHNILQYVAVTLCETTHCSAWPLTTCKRNDSNVRNRIRYRICLATTSLLIVLYIVPLEVRVFLLPIHTIYIHVIAENTIHSYYYYHHHHYYYRRHPPS